MPAPVAPAPVATLKAALCVRIAVQREVIAVAAQGAARPLVVLDQCLALWRGLPALVKIAGSALLTLAAERCVRSPSLRAKLSHWLPLILGLLRR